MKTRTAVRGLILIFFVSSMLSWLIQSKNSTVTERLTDLAYIVIIFLVAYILTPILIPPLYRVLRLFGIWVFALISSDDVDEEYIDALIAELDIGNTSRVEECVRDIKAKLRKNIQYNEERLRNNRDMTSDDKEHTLKHIWDVKNGIKILEKPRSSPKQLKAALKRFRGFNKRHSLHLLSSFGIFKIRDVNLLAKHQVMVSHQQALSEEQFQNDGELGEELIQAKIQILKYIVGSDKCAKYEKNLQAIREEAKQLSELAKVF